MNIQDLILKEQQFALRIQAKRNYRGIADVLAWRLLIKHGRTRREVADGLEQTRQDVTNAARRVSRHAFGTAANANIGEMRNACERARSERLHRVLAGQRQIAAGFLEAA